MRAPFAGVFSDERSLIGSPVRHTGLPPCALSSLIATRSGSEDPPPAARHKRRDSRSLTPGTDTSPSRLAQGPASGAPVRCVLGTPSRARAPVRRSDLGPSAPHHLETPSVPDRRHRWSLPCLALSGGVAPPTGLLRRPAGAPATREPPPPWFRPLAPAARALSRPVPRPILDGVATAFEKRDGHL